jgi:hypothetical protein
MFSDRRFYELLSEINPQFAREIADEEECRVNQEYIVEIPLIPIGPFECDPKYLAECLPGRTDVSVKEQLGMEKHMSMMDKILDASPHWIIAGGAVDIISQEIAININDIDVFYRGPADEFAQHVGELIGKFDVDELITTPNAITIEPRDCSFQIQIINRVYTSIQQVLLGFDLDSSSCAYAWVEGERKFVCIDRYVRARTYSLNIVNPFRRSLTYEKRLLKYQKRGYGILIPGGMTRLMECFNAQMRELIGDADRFLKQLVFPPDQQYLRSDIELLFANPMMHKPSYAVEISDYGIVNPEWMKARSDPRKRNSLQRTRLAWAIHYDEEVDLLSALRERGFFEQTEIIDPGKQLKGSFHPINDEFFANKDADIDFHAVDYLASLNNFIKKRSGMDN